MGLRDIESTLPPGFRFYPSDEELVCHYLYKKVSNEGVTDGTMVEVDLHAHEPWELPEVAKLTANGWYFFSFRDRKYATGSRTNRATKSGYWKATGKDRTIYNPSTSEIVGMRKTLVFYRGRAPNGIKSSWVMNEYRLENPHTPPKEDWALCKVSHKRKGEEEMVSIVSSPPPPILMDDHQPLQGEEIGTTSVLLSSSGPSQENNHNNSSSSSSSSSGFIDVANLLQCNFLDFTPQLEMGSSGGRDELGLFLDVGHDEGSALGFANLGEYRFQVGKDKLY